MTIDEAIRALSKWQSGLRTTPMDFVDEAVRLGIEALKELKEVRKHSVLLTVETLPGETE